MPNLSFMFSFECKIAIVIAVMMEGLLFFSGRYFWISPLQESIQQKTQSAIVRPAVYRTHPHPIKIEKSWLLTIADQEMHIVEYHSDADGLSIKAVSSYPYFVQWIKQVAQKNNLFEIIKMNLQENSSGELDVALHIVVHH